MCDFDDIMTSSALGDRPTEIKTIQVKNHRIEQDSCQELQASSLNPVDVLLHLLHPSSTPQSSLGLLPRHSHSYLLLRAVQTFLDVLRENARFNFRHDDCGEREGERGRD